MRCLVLMPFHANFDPVFQVVKAAAADALPGTPVEAFWLKDVHAPGKITDEIVTGIQDSAFCVADVSGANPNVMWEIGYAMASGKPTILIGQDVKTIPFDLSPYRVTLYDRHDLPALEGRLAEAVRQTLASYPILTTQRIKASAAKDVRSIVVTGSREANALKATRRVEQFLRPYLGRQAVWYCGASGMVDELAAQFLANAKERLMVVGHHRWDVSPTFRALIESGNATFVDASVEHYPKTLEGGERAKYFVSRADLAIIFWDGVSKGSERLLQAFRANSVSALTVFI